MSIKIGITTYSFRWSVLNGMTIQKLLKESMNLGVEVLQICENIDIKNYSVEDIKDIKEMAKGFGLTIEYGTNSIENIVHSINIANLLGSKIVRVVVDNDNLNINDVILKIKSILPELEKYNIKLLIENHFKLTPNEIESIINNVNSNNVAVCLDVLNSVLLLYGPYEAAKILGPYTDCVHVKDCNIERFGNTFIVKGVPLGKGIVNFKNIMKCLNLKRIDSVLLESWLNKDECNNDFLKAEKEWVRFGLEYINNIIKEMINE